LIFVAARTTTAATSHGLPVNYNVRPTVELPDLAVSSLYPSNKITDEWVVCVASVSLRLMANLSEAGRQCRRITAKVIKVFGNKYVPSRQIRFSVQGTMHAWTLDRLPFGKIVDAIAQSLGEVEAGNIGYAVTPLKAATFIVFGKR
jgi:hypothetical protein